MTYYRGPLKKVMTHRHGHPDDAGIRTFYFSKWEAPSRYGTFYVIETMEGEMRLGFEPMKTETPTPKKEDGNESRSL